jgi:hypothetical protein
MSVPDGYDALISEFPQDLLNLNGLFSGIPGEFIKGVDVVRQGPLNEKI